MVGEKGGGVSGPRVVVHAHLDGRVQRRDIVQDRLAVSLVKGLSVPGIGRQGGALHVVEILVGPSEVGVDDAGGEHVWYRAGEVQYGDALVNLAE